MNIIIKILGAVSVTAGVIAVLAGMAEASTKNGVGGMAIVLGGGLFMALGAVAFVLNRDN